MIGMLWRVSSKTIFHIWVLTKSLDEQFIIIAADKPEAFAAIPECITRPF